MDSNAGRDRYNLRWNNYSNNISQVIFEHLQQETLVDITLCCEGQYIKAHKLILSACSDYFKELFNKHANVPHPFFVLNGIKFHNLNNLMKFMYHGEIRVLDTEIEDLLTLGENLRVKGLCSVKFKKPAEGGQVSSEIKSNPVELQPRNTDSNTTDDVNRISSKTPPPLAFTKKDKFVLPKPTTNPRSILKTSQQLTSPGESRILQKESQKPSEEKDPKRDSDSSSSDPETMEHNPKKTVKKITEDNEKESKQIEKERRLSTPKRGNSPKEVLTEQKQHNIEGKSRHSRRSGSEILSTTIKVRAFMTEGAPEVKKRKASETESPQKKEKRMSVTPVITETVSMKNDEKPKSPKKDPPSIEKKTQEKTSALPARPPNPFMIFANEWRKKLAVEHPGENNKELSIRLGNMWKSMSIETKHIYYKLAIEAADEHNQKTVEPQTPSEKEPSKEVTVPVPPKSPQVLDAVQLVKLVMTDADKNEEFNFDTVRVKQEKESGNDELEI